MKTNKIWTKNKKTSLKIEKNRLFQRCNFLYQQWTKHTSAINSEYNKISIRSYLQSACECTKKSNIQNVHLLEINVCTECKSHWWKIVCNCNCWCFFCSCSSQATETNSMRHFEKYRIFNNVKKVCIFWVQWLKSK